MLSFPFGCESKPFWDPIWLVGELTTHVRTYFSGVHTYLSGD